VTSRHLIAVDGVDGSGKSYLARNLIAAGEAIGIGTTLLRVDDFRRPLEWSQVDDEAEAYWGLYYDFAALAAVADACVAGARRVELTTFDPVRECSGPLRHVDLSGVEVVAIEGVFPLRIPAVGAGTLIYLDTSPAEARRRIIARDMDKGRTRAEVERRIDRRYAPCQRRYHAEFAPRERAHLVLDNEDPAAPRLLAARLGDRPDPVRRVLAAAIPVLG